MKKILICLLVAVCYTFTACSDDDWGKEGDPALAHVYFFGFEDWGEFKNEVKYNVKQGATVEIPVQFWCEFTRKYDVTTFYYVAGDLQLGTDYQIVDASGSVLSPDSNGAFSMTWPQAKKGVKGLYVKALNGTKGTMEVRTFDPKDPEGISYEHTLNNSTKDYEVRAFTQNYKVTVIIE